MADIIATIGPASRGFKVLKRMAKEGMSIARVNMKYASRKELLEVKKALDISGVKLMVDILNLEQFSKVKDIDFDYIALAFTETEKQIKDLRKVTNAKIIAKIENKKGVKNIKGIINASDGLMVARGDLGKNVRLEELPIYQKRIIDECNEKNKYAITATEMMLSMVKNKKPTKAEVSDVANAVIDGSNALMLSEETAIGKHPADSVKIMKKIIDTTNRYLSAKNE